MATVLRAALDRDEEFTILWDLRRRRAVRTAGTLLGHAPPSACDAAPDLHRLRPPSLSALNYGAAWMGDNADDIERLGTSIAVLVSSPITRACANLCVRVCSPPQPVLICRDEAEATAFARDQHERRTSAATP